MAFGRNKVEIIVGAKDEATKKLNKIAASTARTAASMKKIGGAMMGIGTAGLVALGLATKQTLEFANSVDKMSKSTGIAREEIQKLRFAAIQEHGSAEALDKGIMNLAVRIGYAHDGLATYIRSFDALGIAYKNADGSARNTKDVLMDMAESMAKGKITTEKLYGVLMLLGVRGGKELIPFLRLGKQGINGLMKESEKYGILTTKQVKDMKAFGDQLAWVKQGFIFVKATIATAVLPFMDKLANSVKGVIRWFVALDPKVKNLTGRIAFFGSIALVAGGAALFLYGTLLTLASMKGLAALSGGIKGLGTSLVVFAKGALIATRNFLGFIVAIEAGYRAGSALMMLIGKMDEGMGKLRKDTEQIARGEDLFRFAKEGFTKGAIVPLGKAIMEKLLPTDLMAAELGKMGKDIDKMINTAVGKVTAGTETMKNSVKSATGGVAGGMVRELIGAFPYMPAPMGMRVATPGGANVSLNFTVTNRKDIYARMEREFDRLGV